MDKAEGVAYAKALGHVSGAWGLSSEAVQLGQREKERGKRAGAEGRWLGSGPLGFYSERDGSPGRR